MGRYEGRTALVTGGTSGIGLATALLLRDEGVRVLVTGRTERNLALARDLLGPSVAVVASDASSLDDVESLAGWVTQEAGDLDLLHVNAGITHGESFAEMTPDIYDRVMGVNVRGPFFTIQRLAPLIRPGGAIVLTTSGSGVLGLPNNSAYAASKASLRSIARTLARELLPSGIRVNAVSPGPIDTGIIERTLPAEQAEITKAHLRTINPMQRFGAPEEIARAVLFLGFEATFTTGAELPVDGGATML